MPCCFPSRRPKKPSAPPPSTEAEELAAWVKLSKFLDDIMSEAPPSREVEWPIEEAEYPSPMSALFHKTRPGQLLSKQYRAIVKLGYGQFTTFWLADNLEWKEGDSLPRYVVIEIWIRLLKEKAVRIGQVTLKIGTSDGLICFDDDSKLINVPYNEFEIEGQKGKPHYCYVYPPTRENLLVFRSREGIEKSMPDLAKKFMSQLIVANHRLNTICGVIHANIKEENILVTLEDSDVLEEFVKFAKTGPLTQSTGPDGTVTHRSYEKKGSLRNMDFSVLLSGFNKAVLYKPDFGDFFLRPFIQNNLHRAPEVLLGTGWTKAMDVWSLGVLAWSMVQGSKLFNFEHIYTSNDGMYNPHAHLAEMISYLGPPPKSLLEKERQMRGKDLGQEYISFMNGGGQDGRTVVDCWGGPFFDDNGEFIRKDLIRPGLSLESSLTTISGEEKRLFLDFLRRTLTWDPAERATTEELMSPHPWLGSVMQELLDKLEKRSKVTLAMQESVRALWKDL